MHSKPDFVIVEPRDPTFLSVLPTVLLPKSGRPKIILDIRSTPVKGGYMETLLFTTAVRMARRLFDGMTIITPMMRKEICDKFHIDPESVGVWTSGASTTSFNPEKYDRMGLRKRFCLDHKFVVFYHGSLGRSYMQGQARGISESIKSIEILKNKCPDLILFLLGDSRSYHWIKELIEECGIQDKVILHDKVNYEDVPQYIALCDCALVPLPDLSLWRNQSPLKLLEYLAMEKVVIATGIPANRYIIGESKCAVYIPSASPEEIAKAILYIHGNREKLKEWGVLGRKIVEEKYTWEKVARDFEDYLLSINPHMS
jgi:glycosyltransferase involved in cell wall biosynthesis